MSRSWLYRRYDSANVADEAKMSDNVYDFIEYYLMRMAEQYAKHGADDIAYTVYDTLDKYVAGEIDVQLIDGQAYVIPMEIIEEYEDDT